MSVEYWQNAEVFGEMPVKCHFIYYKSHTDWDDFQFGLPWREASE